MKRKWTIAAIVVAIVALLAGYDAYRATQYRIALLSMDPQQAPADGQSPVALRFKVTDAGGRPMKGHSLYALPRGGGILSASRVVTDEAGEATYTYYPYKASELQPAKDVQIKVIDESNSVFIEINAKTTVTVPLVQPERSAKSNHSLDDIFGE